MSLGKKNFEGRRQAAVTEGQACLWICHYCDFVLGLRFQNSTSPRECSRTRTLEK
jgi:hypothetical protein